MTNNQADARGVFITFEGGEGAGKTTHIRFLAETLEAQGREVVRLREPGGTDIGEKLRAIVLDPGNAAMCDACELLVYEAARAQLVSQVIKPALDRGAVVLSDRFFDSTRAYQGAGRGLDEAFINAANAFACQGVMPDRTILLMPPSIEDGLVRATKHTGADRLEQAGAAFHARVREAFLSFAEEDPQRMRLVYSATKKSETAQAVFGNLTDLFPEFSDLLATPEHFASLDVKRIHQDKATFVGVSAQYVAEAPRAHAGELAPSQDAGASAAGPLSRENVQESAGV